MENYIAKVYVTTLMSSVLERLNTVRRTALLIHIRFTLRKQFRMVVYHQICSLESARIK